MIIQFTQSVYLITLAALIIPAAYHAAQSHVSHDGLLPGLLAISRGTSIVLLIVYACYLYFQLGTHSEIFQAIESDEEPERPKMNTAAASLAYVSKMVEASSIAYSS